MREWLLLAASVAATLLISLGALQLFAPDLLRSSTQVRIVQRDERVLPFYEGIFRQEDRESTRMILDDPDLIVRARPFYPDQGEIGPNDVLGFRNRRVPTRPRLVTIGDSQTYGTGVPIDAAWPHLLGELLGDADAVYDMSTGGWGAVQYLQMWDFAAFFQPELVVIAFYTGNDPREAFTAAYAVSRFAYLRPDTSLDAGDLPPVAWPSPPSELWRLRFPGGEEMVFTPTLRLASNMDQRAVAAGWEIMARVAERILADSARGGPQPLFTIIPTKERVFEPRLRAAGAPPNAAYDALVEGEAAYTRMLEERIRRAGGRFVDVAGPLRDAARASLALYPHTGNGHMAPPAHAIVARQVYAQVAPLLHD